MNGIGPSFLSSSSLTSMLSKRILFSKCSVSFLNICLNIVCASQLEYLTRQAPSIPAFWRCLYVVLFSTSSAFFTRPIFHRYQLFYHPSSISLFSLHLEKQEDKRFQSSTASRIICSAQKLNMIKFIHEAQLIPIEKPPTHQSRLKLSHFNCYLYE